MDFFPPLSLSFIHDGKRGAAPHRSAADCAVWVYANGRLSASKETAGGIRFVAPAVGCNVIILALRGLSVWKFVSCHLDCKWQGCMERQGESRGESEAWWQRGVSREIWIIPGHYCRPQYHVWWLCWRLGVQGPRPPPPWTVVCGGPWLLRLFSLLLVACWMSLFSGRRSI